MRGRKRAFGSPHSRRRGAEVQFHARKVFKQARWGSRKARKEAPTAIRIFPHKTNAVVLHPLEGHDGTPFHADAEAVLAQVPRRGVPMILHEVKVEKGKPRPTKAYAMSSGQHLVQRLRKLAKLPSTFALDACRHGGMTSRKSMGDLAKTLDAEK
jgi:hypothetical protein